MQTHPSAGARPAVRILVVGERRRLALGLLSRAALVAFGAVSLFGLGGCRAVEAIFKVGVWFGVLVVVAIVAVIGGIAALVLKRK